MQLFTEIQTVVNFIGEMRLKGMSVGLVPTMGALHEGHISLIKNSSKENDLTVCSIFVNPTQFNNPEDLQNYPRNIDKDLLLLENSGCRVVFMPDVEGIYHNDRVLNLSFGYLENIMEGKFRPDHFKGVGLIICKLFNIIQPDRAYFGTKDLQQLVIIQKLTDELNFNVDIRSAETLRSEKGLALSSRNERLSDSERDQALILYNSLTEAKKMLLSDYSIERTKKEIFKKCNESGFFKLEYFEIVNRQSLLPVVNIHEHDHVSACIAGFLGKTRLIDNISII